MRRWPLDHAYIIVARFLIFVALLVSFGFRLVRFALFHVERLPPLSEHLADLTCSSTPLVSRISMCGEEE